MLSFNCWLNVFGALRRYKDCITKQKAHRPLVKFYVLSFNCVRECSEIECQFCADEVMIVRFLCVISVMRVTC